MSEEMPDQFEERVRQIVREEIASYETKLIDWATEEGINGMMHRNEQYHYRIREWLANAAIVESETHG